MPNDRLKTADVYERLASGLNSALAAAGMQRVRRIYWPCWWRPSSRSNLDRLYLSMQIDRKATDTYAGGQFRVELEKSASDRPASGLAGRALFFQLLTGPELADLLAQQNRVIQGLPKPPAPQVEAYPAGPVRKEYLSWFEAQDAFDVTRCWMRYRTFADVDAWISALRPFVGLLVDRADHHLERRAIQLGKGSLLGRDG